MILPYNHCDPLEKQIPLPIELRDLPEDLSVFLKDPLRIRVVIPTASSVPIIIELCTDSSHLASFFSANWANDVSTEQPNARIMALKRSASFYGMDKELDQSRWFCPTSKQVWMFGTEYYGNLKITVRGLCSELAPDEEMFLHGCSLSVFNRGVVLAGMSGAGKTTVTSALIDKLGKDVKIINDDWGALSLDSGLLQFTREGALHMKYPSVQRITPNLPIGPDTHPSENFHGDRHDPRARLLISPKEVYGEDNLYGEKTMKLFVVVLRTLSEKASIRTLEPEDISVVEDGQYSSFYQRNERYLNGSLFLFDNIRMERIRRQHITLLTRYKCIMLNNSAEPQTSADLVLSALQ
ncbi:MAG: hypothetical protein IPL32_17335 [Chloracidobacterium sp.]|nr:hypothetical protein [Chloracidobacterium sp.]